VCVIWLGLYDMVCINYRAVVFLLRGGCEGGREGGRVLWWVGIIVGVNICWSRE